MEEGPEGSRGGAREAGLRGSLRSRPAAHQRRLDAVPAAHDLEDEAGEEGRGRSRLAIVFNGSPLFTGDAGSGESEIRKWVIENDWLEAIVALPDQLFYNTGISTYIWIVTNRKPKARKGKVQLINGVELFQKMRKSLGNKRNELGYDGTSTDIVRAVRRVRGRRRSKVFDNEDFGFRRITVERPLRLTSRHRRNASSGSRRRARSEARYLEEEGQGGRAKRSREGLALQASILKSVAGAEPRARVEESGCVREGPRGALTKVRQGGQRRCASRFIRR